MGSHLNCLIKFLAPGYFMPTGQTITGTLWEEFKRAQTIVNKQLSSSDAGEVSLTTDRETSLAQDGYIGVTAYFINLDWMM